MADYTPSDDDQPSSALPTGPILNQMQNACGHVANALTTVLSSDAVDARGKEPLFDFRTAVEAFKTVLGNAIAQEEREKRQPGRSRADIAAMVHNAVSARVKKELEEADTSTADEVRSLSIRMGRVEERALKEKAFCTLEHFRDLEHKISHVEREARQLRDHHVQCRVGSFDAREVAQTPAQLAKEQESVNQIDSKIKDLSHRLEQNKTSAADRSDKLNKRVAKIERLDPDALTQKLDAQHRSLEQLRQKTDQLSLTDGARPPNSKDRDATTKRLDTLEANLRTLTINSQEKRGNQPSSKAFDAIHEKLSRMQKSLEENQKSCAKEMEKIKASLVENETEIQAMNLAIGRLQVDVGGMLEPRSNGSTEDDFM